ncbi:uncharacterized protein LOC143199840 [Rhynchophorus ferrugineus]|uniref:uncharacterized protein LOC143199840 n=1 Tax=Rhynchophorus ferrugineus TaxID=354439 RepID=UPI003FCE32FB
MDNNMDLNILLKENKELRTNNERLNQQLLQLSKDMAAIRLQLQGHTQDTPKRHTNYAEDYYTDEDELALEVGEQSDWTEVTNKKDKKRKKKSEMTPSPVAKSAINIKKKEARRQNPSAPSDKGKPLTECSLKLCLTMPFVINETHYRNLKKLSLR